MKPEHILQRNLRVLNKENPALALELERADYPAGWQVYPARNEMPTLEIEYQGKKLSVHSRYNPQKEAVAWAQSLPEDWDVLVVFGFGLGYHWEEVLSVAGGRPVIFVEIEAAHLKGALAARDLAKLMMQWGFRVVISPDPVQVVSDVFREYTAKRIELRALPAYGTIYPDYWQLLRQTLKDLLRQYRVNIATQVKKGEKWLENYFANIREYYQGVPLSSLFGLFQNRPAIIVAAGPSLEKNVGMLHELRDRALIIAAGSAIRVLEKHGVKPHLVVSIEGSENNYRHFAGYVPEGVPLVFAPTIYPPIVKEYAGPKISAEIDICQYVSWLDRQIGFNPGMLVCGPSVANVCLDMAVKLGANPIILTGQDLAFPGGKTHADGAKHRRTVDIQEPKYFLVDDIFGGKVPTNAPFYAMKVWFEQYIRDLNKGITVIDASEGGALIQGTEILSLAEVRDKYLTHCFYPEQLILQQFHSMENHGDYLDKLAAELDKLLEQVEVIEEFFQQGLLLSKTLLAKVNEENVNSVYGEAFSQFKKLEQQVRNLPLFQVFIKDNIEPQLRALKLAWEASKNKEKAATIKLQKLVDTNNAFLTEVWRNAQFFKTSWEKSKKPL